MEKAVPTRMSRDAWIDHGLAALAATGPEALNANALSRALGVTRGSFYWHFENLEAFEHAVLAAWRARTTEAAIAALEGLPPGQGRLEGLIERVLAGPEPVEGAIRRWAASNPGVAEALAAVDRLRLDYVRAELETAGLGREEAEARATTMIWACAGRTAVAPALAAGGHDWSKRLAALFATPADEA